MMVLQSFQYRLNSIGIWLAVDPRRAMMVITAIFALATIVALAVGLSPAEVLVGPSGGGGSGGPG